MSLQIAICNQTGADQLFAHITGRDEQGLILLSSDGQSLIRPGDPGDGHQPISDECAIAIGGPGATQTVTIPHMFGARVWLCKDQPMQFFIASGANLVEPSATNQSDPNYELDWGFCELTFNQDQLYANISFVDFVGLPVSLQLTSGDGSVKTVPGLSPEGLDHVCSGLEAQGQSDNAGWDRLVMRGSSGQILRALSPNAGAAMMPGLFEGYFQSYVDAVWEKYSQEDITVNTQAEWGNVTGRVIDGQLIFDGVGAFGQPSTADIFGCSSGPFTTAGAPVALNVGARLAAGFNRSTLHLNNQQPEGESVENYYTESITNHYARLCHEASVQGRGYAFPYDDVSATNGVDQSGFVNDGNPVQLTISVGCPLDG